MQKEVDKNLSEEFGKKLMTIRSIYSEGFFGDKKYNWGYDILRRTGQSGVNLEILLYAIGKNMRKFCQIYYEKIVPENKKLKQLINFARSVRG